MMRVLNLTLGIICAIGAGYEFQVGRLWLAVILLIVGAWNFYDALKPR